MENLPKTNGTGHSKPDKDVVKNATDLVELAREFGVALTQQGSEWKALCPFHDETTPSFSVNAEKQVFNCFGCDEGGDVFSFIQQAIEVPFPEALDFLADRAGITNHGSDVTDEPKECADTPSKTRATVQPQGCTVSAFAKDRKLTEKFLHGLGISDSTYPRGSGTSAIRVPYLDAEGQEIAAQYRIAVRSESPPHRWPKRTKTCLYGLWRRNLRKDSIILVEGVTDCLTLWHHGYNAIGVPGASNFKDERDAAALEPFGRIYVVVEPGSSGETLIERIAKSEIRDRVHLVRLDGFKDPSEMHIDAPERFRERFESAIASALPWEQHEADSSDEKRQGAWEKCKELASDPDILGRITQKVEQAGAVGVNSLIRLLILIFTSRVLSRPVSVAIKGVSSGGKSFVIEQVLQAFPADAYFFLTGMSEHALAYLDEPLSHRFIIIAEASGTGDMADYFLRSLLSEGHIRYAFVDKCEEGMRTRQVEIKGPTGLAITTTKTRLHAENETRLLSLTVEDSREQTKAVFLALATDREPIDFSDEQALQQWISVSDNRVVIPYARRLAELIPPIAVRLRRDFRALLGLVEAHVILNQNLRQRDAEGRIVARIEDYESVWELVRDQLAEVAEATVPPDVRGTVDAVTALGTEVSGKEVGAHLKIDKSSASRRLKSAESLGFVKNLAERPRQPGRWCLADPMPGDLEILPHPEDLSGCTVARVSEGVTTDTSMHEHVVEFEEGLI